MDPLIPVVYGLITLIVIAVFWFFKIAVFSFAYDRTKSDWDKWVDEFTSDPRKRKLMKNLILLNEKVAERSREVARLKTKVGRIYEELGES